MVSWPPAPSFVLQKVAGMSRPLGKTPSVKKWGIPNMT